MTSEKISEKIRKILALAERAGTEAEAETAMAKAQALLAEHNLDINTVRESGNEKPEDIVTDSSVPTELRNTAWIDGIYGAIARLYFCEIYMWKKWDADKREYYRNIYIMGRPSNIEVVKYIASYLVRTAQNMAQEQGKAAAQEMANEGVTLNVRAWRASFKVGFYYRIHNRVEGQIKAARAGEIKGSDGRALVLAPVYDREKNALEVYKKEINLKLGRASAGMSARSSSGYKAGQEAANGMNLHSSGLASHAQTAIKGY